MSAQPSKRRRITPVPVHEDDAELTVLPPPTVVLSPEKAPADQSVDPPEPGRRIWISLDAGYDHNYRKLLNQLGVKHSKEPKAPASPGMPRPPGAPMEGLLMNSGPLLAQSGRKRPEMLAMERIQRRIQLEMQGAKRGLDESEDDEDDEEERPGDADDEGGADEDDPDGEGKDKEDDEPEEDAQDRNYYDYTADWIDDTEFIEAIQNRDARKQKIQGFYVNAGEIERVGEREPPPDSRKKRKTKANDEPANEDTAMNGHAAAAAPVATDKAAPNHPQPMDAGRGVGGAASASAASPSQQRQHRTDAMATAAAANGAAAPAAAAVAGTASSLAAMAMAAAAGHTPAEPSSTPPDAARAPPHSPTIPASMTAAAGKDVHPSPATLASRPSHDGSAATTPSANALTPDMAAHVAQMRSVVNDVPADMRAGLNGWTYSENIRNLIEKLRETAMRTVPHPPHSKKKMPSDISACLEAIVRPFYRETEAAPNTNKAKRAVWGVIMPLLAPWAAENTVKTKMQNLNSRVTGAHALAHSTLSGVALSIGSNGQSRIMEADVIKACGSFLEKCESYYDMSLDDPRAQQEIWERTVQLIEEKGGPMLSVEILRQMYRRYKEA